MGQSAVHLGSKLLYPLQLGVHVLLHGSHAHVERAEHCVVPLKQGDEGVERGDELGWNRRLFAAAGSGSGGGRGVLMLVMSWDWDWCT